MRRLAAWLRRRAEDVAAAMLAAMLGVYTSRPIFLKPSASSASRFWCSAVLQAMALSAAAWKLRCLAGVMPCQVFMLTVSRSKATRCEVRTICDITS